MSYNNDDDNSLMSAHTEAAAVSALASLTSGLTSAHTFEGGTVEGIVREMLRPMLREWMDANLPTLVASELSKEVLPHEFQAAMALVSLTRRRVASQTPARTRAMPPA